MSEMNVIPKFRDLWSSAITICRVHWKPFLFFSLILFLTALLDFVSYHPLIDLCLLMLGYAAGLWISIVMIQTSAHHLRGIAPLPFRQTLLGPKGFFWRYFGTKLGIALCILVPLGFGLLCASTNFRDMTDLRLYPILFSSCQSVLGVSLGGFAAALVYLVLYFAPTAAILEPSHISTFPTSFDLVLLNFWPVVGRIILFWMIIGIIPGILSIVDDFILGESAHGLHQLLDVIWMLYNALITPLVTAFTTAFYCRLRPFVNLRPEQETIVIAPNAVGHGKIG